MLDKLITKIEQVGEYFHTMWSYLKFAVREDKADAELRAHDPAHAEIEPNANLKNWVKVYGIVAAGLFILLFMLLSRLISKKSLPKRSHHGYNRNGERY